MRTTVNIIKYNDSQVEAPQPNYFFKCVVCELLDKKLEQAFFFSVPQIDTSTDGCYSPRRKRLDLLGAFFFSRVLFEPSPLLSFLSCFKLMNPVNVI